MDVKILALVADIAQELTQVGAEVSRVEESVRRICKAYGCTRTDVYATTTNIILSVESPDGNMNTLHRRMGRIDTDMERLHRLNAIVRWMTAKAPDADQIIQAQKEIAHTKKTPAVVCVLMYGAIAASFCVFFGSRVWRDILAALVVGILMGSVSVWMDKGRSNRILIRFVCAVTAATLVLIADYAGIVTRTDHISIGNIMTLIPGIGLTNSLRDLLTGDTITGTLRLIEVILLTVAIAGGFFLPSLLIGGLLK